MAEHIRSEARRLFSEKGYAAVAISDIVEAADISKPTLYYYFPDKEHLYKEVLLQIIESAGEYCNGVLCAQDRDLTEKLVDLATGFMDYSSVSLPCMLRDVAQHLKDPLGQQILALYEEKIHQPFEKVFEEAIARGELYQHPPRMLSELFLTLLDWLSLRFSFHERNHLTCRQKAIQIVHLFMEGARREPTLS